MARGAASCRSHNNLRSRKHAKSARMAGTSEMPLCHVALFTRCWHLEADQLEKNPNQPAEEQVQLKCFSNGDL